MIRVRKSDDRGHANHGWLDTYHTFSFDTYHDPKNMGFRSLRVINEDRVAPGQGFGMHPHRDKEIITYVLEGTLEHRDSMGNRGVIRSGEVQRMSAGTGVRHSEFNHSEAEPVHLLQIWLEPNEHGIKPSYEEKSLNREQLRGKLTPVAAPDPNGSGAVTIHQDAELFATVLAGEDKVTHKLDRGRHAWVQVARGSVSVNGQVLAAGDGAAISDEPAVQLAATGTEAAEVLLFDLA